MPGRKKKNADNTGRNEPEMSSSCNGDGGEMIKFFIQWQRMSGRRNAEQFISSVSIEKIDSKARLKDFVFVLDKLLVKDKLDGPALRMVNLVVTYCSTKTSAASDAKFSGAFSIEKNRESHIGNDVVQGILEHLVSRLVATSKTVRLRAAQIIGKILCVVPEDGSFIDESLWIRMEKQLLDRLYDKVSSTRASAATALERLQNADLCISNQDPVCNALATLAKSDNSAEVRKAALRAMSISKHELEVLISRTRDIKEDVRVCAYDELAKRVHVHSLSVTQSNRLISDGLQDRDETVRDSCTRLVCGHWLNLLSGNPLELLACLGVEDFEETALLMLRTLFSEKTRSESNRSLDGVSSELLNYACNFDLSGDLEPLKRTPEGALYMFARCEALVSQGNDGNVDEVVNDLSSLCASMQEISNKCAEGLPDNMNRRQKFVLKQFLRMGALVDSEHDMVGQENGIRIVKMILVAESMSEPDVLDAAFEFLRSLYVSHGNGARIGSSDTKPTSEEDNFFSFGLHTVLESSLSKNQDKSFTSVNDYDGETNAFEPEMAENFNLNSFEIAETTSQALYQLDAESAEPALCTTVRRALELCRAFLRTVSGFKPPQNANLLLRHIIMPYLNSIDDQTRHRAVECYALYSQVDCTLARKSVDVLFSVASNVCEIVEIRVVALQGIFDLIALWGLSGLLRGSESGESEQLAESSKELVEKAKVKLLSYLDTDEPEIRLAAGEGLARLATVGRLVDSRVFQCLLILYFHDSSKQDDRLRQCLGVCFPLVAEKSKSGRKALENMALPLVRALCQPEPSSPLESIDFESMIRYLVCLLSYSDGKFQRSLGETIILEIVSSSASKQRRSLLSTLSSLNVDPCDAKDIGYLQKVTEHIKEDSDTTANRHLSRWIKQLKSILQQKGVENSSGCANPPVDDSHFASILESRVVSRQQQEAKAM